MAPAKSESDDLARRLDDLRAEIADLAKTTKRISKKLKDIDPDSLGSLGHALEATKVLRKSSLGIPEVDQRIQALHDEIDARAAALKLRARGDIFTALAALTQDSDYDWSVVGDSPPTGKIGPLNIELDLDKGRAAIQFAREDILYTALDPNDIWLGWGKAMDELMQWSDAPALFEQVLRAYRAVLLARGEEPGSRVDLVDLLLPMSLYQLDVGSWRRGDPGKLEPVPRYQLARALMVIHARGLVQHRGRRIDLGPATGGSARNKKNVIFVPSPTGSQYYLSVRFVPAMS